MLIFDDYGGEVIEGRPDPVLGEVAGECWIVTVSGGEIWRILSLPRGALTLELRNRLLIGIISWYVFAFSFGEGRSWLIERESQVHIPGRTDPRQGGQLHMIHARFLA